MSEESGRNKESMRNIIIVALSVCFACSVVVSSTAVILKPQILANKELDRNKSVLMAAGLYRQGETSDSEIDGLFSQFRPRVVDLREQRFLSDAEAIDVGIDISKYDQRKAAKDPDLSKELSKDEDIAAISRRAHYSIAYLLEKDGAIDRIVLPVHGYGLWSVMYGFVALEGDGNTVAGITFYDQKETAGLGGEVDNPAWKAIWPGKKIYDDDNQVALKVLKGAVQPGASGAEYQVDGLSGATLTSRGVENMIAYWLGDSAFGPILKNLEG